MKKLFFRHNRPTFFDKLHGKCLQDIANGTKEYAPLCSIFGNYANGEKDYFFLKIKVKHTGFFNNKKNNVTHT